MTDFKPDPIVKLAEAIGLLAVSGSSVFGTHDAQQAIALAGEAVKLAQPDLTPAPRTREEIAESLFIGSSFSGKGERIAQYLAAFDEVADTIRAEPNAELDALRELEAKLNDWEGGASWRPWPEVRAALARVKAARGERE